MDKNNTEMQEHIERNESMWQIWEEHGVNSATNLTVDFHFYSSNKANVEMLCKELIARDIKFDLKQTRTLIFLKRWILTADITKKWSLPELQRETENFYVLSKKVGVVLDGCGASMPK